MEIEEVKKSLPNRMNMQDYAANLKGNELTVILRDYNEPATPPCREEGIQILDFDKNPRPSDEVTNAYGTKTNVPGINVVNAIKEARSWSR